MLEIRDETLLVLIGEIGELSQVEFPELFLLFTKIKIKIYTFLKNIFLDGL
jgi:hypothetical protein